MSRGPLRGEMTLDGPVLLACGAYLSQRQKSARCQTCYGRRKCVCSHDTVMPCVDGTHLALGASRSRAPGRAQRGFVDLNNNIPGFQRDQSREYVSAMRHGRRGMER